MCEQDHTLLWGTVYSQLFVDCGVYYRCHMSFSLCVCVSVFKFLSHQNIEKENHLGHDFVDIAGKLLYFRVFAIFLFLFQTTCIQKVHFPFRIWRCVVVSPRTNSVGSRALTTESVSYLSCLLQHTSLLQPFIAMSQLNGYTVLFPFCCLYRSYLH